MTQQWAQDFLSATEHRINETVPVTVNPQPQQQQSQNDSSTEAPTPWPPRVFIDLAYGVPFLSVLPSKAWQSQFMLAVTGRFASFNEAEAAEMLSAMAHWKAAVMASAMPGSFNSRNDNNLVRSQADTQTANMPISLIEGFLMVIAGSAGLHPTGSLISGKLGVLAMAKLPAALRVLDWPVNPQVASACLQHVTEYDAAMQASRVKAAALLDKYQQILAESNKPQQQQLPKKGKKGRLVGKTEQLTAQQRQQLEKDIGLLQGMLEQADAMLSQLQVVTSDWQQLLAERQSSAGGVSDSGMLGRGMQDGSLIQGASGLDVDSLMGGMLSAVGMPGAPDEAGDYRAMFDSAVAAGLEMDDVLGVLEAPGMMAKQQGYDPADRLQHDEGYIDTTAVDVVGQ